MACLLYSILGSPPLQTPPPHNYNCNPIFIDSQSVWRYWVLESECRSYGLQRTQGSVPHPRWIDCSLSSEFRVNLIYFWTDQTTLSSRLYSISPNQVSVRSSPPSSEPSCCLLCFDSLSAPHPRLVYCDRIKAHKMTIPDSSRELTGVALS